MTKVYPLQNCKGLFIGINYENTPNELKGCVNDSKSLQKYFNIDSELLISNQTKHNIITKLRELSNLSYQTTIRNFIIQYSGHGMSCPDYNGDEIDGKDEALVSSDCKAILDDELAILLNDFHPSSKILFIVDACHSESILDLPYTYREQENYIIQNNNIIKPKIIMISGCKDEQYSLDTYSNSRKQSCGALTNLLLQFDFFYVPIFDLKLNLQSGLKWANQMPCISTNFELSNKKIYELLEF